MLDNSNQKFWLDGQTWSGLSITSADQGTQTFWIDGSPGKDMFSGGDQTPIQQMLVLGTLGTLGRR